MEVLKIRKKGRARGEMPDREDPAGQLFCASHTTLGCEREIRSTVHMLKDKLGMENFSKGFLVDVYLHSKYDTVSSSYSVGSKFIRP